MQLSSLSQSVMANEVSAPSAIPLFDNRFRIDDGVKASSFIVKCQPGPSVILVRPDGSKL